MQPTVVDLASAALRKLLAVGQYQAGDRLPPERELADTLGLARPTLREAIRRLAEAGLLESRRGSGTYVVNVDLASVFAVRLQLEPYAAGLAARQRSAADAQRLAALSQELLRTVDEPERFAAADVAIHHVVAGAAGNPVLESMLERLSELAQLSRAVTSPDDEARKATLRDLRPLVRAIRGRDEAAATAAMRRHLEALRDLAAQRPSRNRRLEGLSALPRTRSAQAE